jgi:hypothetical protein
LGITGVALRRRASPPRLRGPAAARSGSGRGGAAHLARVGRGIDRALEASAFHFQHLLQRAAAAVRRHVRLAPRRVQLPLRALLLAPEMLQLPRLLLGRRLVPLVLRPIPRGSEPPTRAGARDAAPGEAAAAGGCGQQSNELLGPTL